MIEENNSIDVELNEVLELLNRDELVDFLKTELTNNYELREKFITKHKSQFSNIEIDEYISQVMNVLNAYENNRYYIKSEEVVYTINKVIDNVVPNCLKNSRINQAVLIVESLFYFIINEESHFGCLYLSNLATRYKQIICIADMKLKHEIHMVIIDLLSKASKSRMLRADQLITKLELILIDDFKDDSEREDTKRYFETLCSKENRQEFSEDYFERQVMNLININEVLNNTIEIENICNEYSDLFEVCNYSVNKLTQNELYVQAVDVIINARDNANDKDKYKKLTSLLCDVYEKLELIEEVKTELIMMLSMEAVCDLDSFNRLKSNYSIDEWLKIRKCIISKFTNRYAQEQYYYSEQMKDELYAIAICSDGIEKLVKYHYLIKGFNSEEVLEKYRNYIKLIEFEASRGNYIHICDVLILMQDYSGGDLIVFEVIEELSRKYKRRVSLINLLNLVKTKTYKQKRDMYVK